VRTLLEHRGQHLWQWAAIESIAGKIGCVPQALQTLKNNVRLGTHQLTASG